MVASMPQRARWLRLACLLPLVAAACGGSQKPLPGSKKIEVAQVASITSIKDLTAPDFAAVDHQGDSVVLSKTPKDAITILVFYRGSW